MDNNQNNNDHPQYINQEYNNANIVVNTPQSGYEQAITEYSGAEKKNNRRNFFISLILCIIACVHHFMFQSKISAFLEETLTNSGMEKSTIDIILTVYLVISLLFVIITLWHVVKRIKILKFIYILAVLVYLGNIGYTAYKNDKLLNNLKNTPSASFVTRTKDICRMSYEEWKKDTMLDTAKKITYYAYNGKQCNNKMLAFLSDDISYSITIDASGNIIDYKISDGRFQYIYNGEGLLYETINNSSFIKVDDSNRITFNAC